METLQRLLDEVQIERKKDKERAEHFSKKALFSV